MLIHQYFADLQRQIHSFPFLSSAELTFDERTPHIGLLTGQLTFHDGSVLARAYSSCAADAHTGSR